jgi:hypothetical protein
LHKFETIDKSCLKHSIDIEKYSEGHLPIEKLNYLKTEGKNRSGLHDRIIPC